MFQGNMVIVMDITVAVKSQLAATEAPPNVPRRHGMASLHINPCVFDQIWFLIEPIGLY